MKCRPLCVVNARSPLSVLAIQFMPEKFNYYRSVISITVCSLNNSTINTLPSTKPTISSLELIAQIQLQSDLSSIDSKDSSWLSKVRQLRYSGVRLPTTKSFSDSWWLHVICPEIEMTCTFSFFYKVTWSQAESMRTVQGLSQFRCIPKWPFLREVV